MFIRQKLSLTLMALAIVCVVSATARAQSSETEETENPNDLAARAAVERLSSSDSLLRQQAAEELARLSANDQQKMVEGYYIQEKNPRVRLALAWALYRMSKSQLLFAVVRDLDSSRALQAAGYLRTLDTAEPLYMFLSNAKPRIQIELLKVMADIGDQTTLAQIQPLTESYDLKVSAAAQRATFAINERLERTRPEVPERPRQVGQVNDSSP